MKFKVAGVLSAKGIACLERKIQTLWQSIFFESLHRGQPSNSDHTARSFEHMNPL